MAPTPRSPCSLRPGQVDHQFARQFLQVALHRIQDAGGRGLDGQPALFGLALLAWLGLLVAISLRRLWPLDLPVVLIGLLVLNIVTFFSYAFDKSAAERGQWRTRESTLHLLALMGGWPAARLAQQALRHKSSKREFLAVYAVTVVLNLGALGWWISQGH